MLVYHFDPETFAYIFKSSVLPDEGEPPPNTTTECPPFADLDTQQVVFRDGEWVVEPKG